MMEELTDFEKLIESVNQLAALVYEYYKALKEKGFSEGAALMLSADYQKEIINMSKPAKGAG
jgi:hypothetical protein